MSRTTSGRNSTQHVRPEARAFARPNTSAAGRLRLANLVGVNRLAVLVAEAGFTDVTIAQCAAFRYEGPEGRRPTEIATKMGMSKQSINDGLHHLEARGYLFRTPHPDDGRARVVRLTDRGRELQETIWSAARQVEDEWRAMIGEPDWSTFSRVLDVLAAAALEQDDEE